MHVFGNESNLLYNLVCQLEYNLLFVKFLLKPLTLKINLNHQYYNTYCKVTNCSLDPKEIGSGNGPNKPNTINL